MLVLGNSFQDAKSQDLSTDQKKRNTEELKKAVGEELHVIYPSALSSSNPYLKELVRIEFGGRNITDPKEQHKIVPTLAQFVPNFHFPIAWVDVLSGERTFWEKATLAHVECNKPSVRNAERLSRHWYDLFILADHEIGRAAMRNSALLQDVIKYKKSSIVRQRRTTTIALPEVQNSFLTQKESLP